MSSITWANLVWSDLLPVLPQINGLPLAGRTLLGSFMGNQRKPISAPLLKQLRTAGLFGHESHRPRPTPAGVAAMAAAALAHDGENLLRETPNDLDGHLHLLGVKTRDVLTRLSALNGTPLGSAQIILDTPQRAALAQIASTWDWTGIEFVGMPPQDLMRMRVQGQALIAWVRSQPGAPTLAAAVETLGLPTGQDRLVLRWLIESLVLFPRYDAAAERLHLGFHPARQGLAGAAPIRSTSPLTATLPTPTGTGSLLADMETILIAVHHTPASYRKDGHLTIKSEKALSAYLTPVVPIAGIVTLSAAARVTNAMVFLQKLRLLTPDELAMPTPAARPWLAMAPSTRFRQLAEALRARLLGIPEPNLWTNGLRSVNGLSSVDHLHAIRATLTHALPMDAWLDAASSRLPSGFYHRDILRQLFGIVLFPTGLMAYENGVVALTPAGGYALTLTDTWPHDDTTYDDKPLVVQADFTCIFLSPRPVLEVDLARCAERLPGATSTGVLYRLTRASVRNAAIAGHTPARILAILEDASRKPLPANVVHEITAWASSIRAARLALRQVITVDDAATADWVMTLLHNAERLGPTAIGVPHNTNLKALIAKALEHDIAIESV